MSILADLFAAGTGGVVTGLVGTITTSITNYKMQKLNNEHQVKMVEVETNAMIAETNANIKITETKISGDLELSENEIYGETIKQNGVKNLSNDLIAKLLGNPWTMFFGVVLAFLLGIVDVLKAIIRPGLTIYLVGVTTWITLVAYRIVSYYDQVMTVTQALDLFTQVIFIIIYLTVSCVTWWFGDRRTAKFLYRLNDGNIREK